MTQKQKVLIYKRPDKDKGECNLYCKYYICGGKCDLKGKVCPKILVLKSLTDKEIENMKNELGKTLFLYRAEAEIAIYGEKQYF